MQEVPLHQAAMGLAVKNPGMSVVGVKVRYDEFPGVDGGVETVDEPKPVVTLQTRFCPYPDIAPVILSDGQDIVAIQPAGIIDVTGDIAGVQRPGLGGLSVDRDIQAKKKKRTNKYKTRSTVHF